MRHRSAGNDSGANASLLQLLEALLGFGVVRILGEDGFIPVGGGGVVRGRETLAGLQVFRVVFAGIGVGDQRVTGLGTVGVQALGDAAVFTGLGLVDDLQQPGTVGCCFDAGLDEGQLGQAVHA